MEQMEFIQVVRVVTAEVLRYLDSSDTARMVPGAAIGEFGSEPERANVGQSANEIDVTGSLAERISCGSYDVDLTSGIAGLIDHTMLNPEAAPADIRKLCQEAMRFGFASVCVNPCNVATAAHMLRGTKVKVCSVVGFPLGATLPQVKVYEAQEAIKAGAQEIDMVINVGALKSGQDDVVEIEIRGVASASHRSGAICKVILETALLTKEEKVRALLACRKAGADFVKTSTGFSTAGATPDDVALMRAVVGSGIGVKAAGGVRTLEDLKKMVCAGATRIGSSASVRIMEQAYPSAHGVAGASGAQASPSY